MFQIKKIIVLAALVATPQFSWAKQNCEQLPTHWLMAEIQSPATMQAGLIHLKAHGVYRVLDLFCNTTGDCTGFLNGGIVEGNLKKIENAKNLVQIQITSIFAPEAFLTGDETFVCKLENN